MRQLNRSHNDEVQLIKIVYQDFRVVPQLYMVNCLKHMEVCNEFDINWILNKLSVTTA